MSGELRVRTVIRSKRLVGYAAMALLVLGLAAHAEDQANIPARKDYASVATNLESMIRQEMDDKQLPAFSIALVDGNQIVWAQGFGYQDPDKKIPATAHTVYRVGSV